MLRQNRKTFNLLNYNRIQNSNKTKRSIERKTRGVQLWFQVLQQHYHSAHAAPPQTPAESIGS